MSDTNLFLSICFTKTLRRNQSNPSPTMNFASMVYTTWDQLTALPTVPRLLLLPLFFMFPFLHPMLDKIFSQNIRNTLWIHLMAAAISWTDFVFECSKRWFSGTLSSDAKVPRSTRERFEHLWRYVVDSMRWLLICALFVAFGVSLIPTVLALYSVYQMLWGRKDSHAATLAKMVVGFVFPGLGFGASSSSAGDKSVPLGGDGIKSADRCAYYSRTTSLKGGSHSRCVVMEEGPHFKKRSRGCLLSA